MQGLKDTDSTEEAVSAEFANASRNKKRKKAEGEREGELNHAGKALRALLAERLLFMTIK